MIIKVKLIGIISPLEKDQQKIKLPRGATINQLVETIAKDYDDLDIEVLKTSSFIINKEAASLETILRDNDEVFILNILGGG